MRIIFLGAPGTGKGTQALYFSKMYSIPQISTGEILRDAVKKGTELGKKAKSIMDAGDLVPDDIILQLIRDRLSQQDCKNGYILDGFPRTISQAEGLERILKDNAIEAVIYFDIDQNAVVSRLTSRRVCSKCGYNHNLITDPPEADNICRRCGGKVIQRDDDKEETVRNRLQVYEKNTAPLVDYYEKKGNLYKIDANGAIDDVRAEIHNVLKNIRD